MLNISDEQKDLYRADSVQKTITITVPSLNIELTNEDLVAESVQLTERIETEANLMFKGCNASVFSFQVAHFNQDIRGRYIEVTIQAGDEGLVLPLFSGYVQEQSNITFEDYVTDITAYDALLPVLRADVTAWYNGLTFPITLKNFRNSFFSYVGMTQEEITLVNDSAQIAKSITDATIKGETIIKSICQLNGRFGMYGRDKQFHYVKLGSINAGLFPSESTFPSDETFPAEPNASETIRKSTYSAIDYQPYDTLAISRVSIIGQNGAVKGQSGDTSGDTFFLTENKLAWGLQNAAQAAANILDEVAEVAFTPAHIESGGLPYLECGDILLANTRINAITSYILERTLSGIQALEDSYTGQIDEKRTPYTPSVQTEVNANASAISTTNSNLATTNSNLSNLNAKVNRIDADYASVGQLNALSAEINSVKINYATINQLNAVNAKFNNLNANNITAGRLRASYIDIQSFSSVNLTVNNLRAISLYAACPDVGGGVSLTPRWQWFPSYNRYMLVSQETGRLG